MKEKLATEPFLLLNADAIFDINFKRFDIMKNLYDVLSGVIPFIYYLAFDRSGVFFSRGLQLSALLGEYLFGRLVMLAGLLATIKPEMANSLISYSPAILQYVIGGGFTAGFTGIIFIVKRFINFISGLTAKVFLSEFSRLYKSDNWAKLEKSYRI